MNGKGTEGLLFAEAFFAHTVEIETVCPDVTANSRFRSVVQVFLRREVKVLHHPTLLTDEMIVVLDHRIISTQAFAEIQFADLSLFFQDVEVAIDGTERDARNMLSDLIIDPLGGGMRFGTPENQKDLFPLSASFCSEDFHSY